MPNVKQKELLDKHFGACRWFYNYALEKKVSHYSKHKKTLSRYDIQRELPSLKKDKPWLIEVNAQSLQSELRRLDVAYTKFFREKSGFPKFKKHGERNSFDVPQNFYILENKLVIPKFKDGIKIVMSRELPSVAKSINISVCNEKYYANILCEIKPKERKDIDIKTAIGLDMGLKDFVVDSEGERYSIYKSIKLEKKLAREQKKLSKMKKGSNNYELQRIGIAKIYEKIANSRRDSIHKISASIIGCKSVYTYCIEDLNILGMLKNHCLAKSISNASWNEFFQQLEYKSEMHGKNVLKIGRFDPSSRLCPCGFINKDLLLSDREWTCPECGSIHDRDILAANNIKTFAFNKQNTVGHTEFKPVEIEQ